eukprot:2597405-Prymnesium_polylepis.1
MSRRSAASTAECSATIASRASRLRARGRTQGTRALARRCSPVPLPLSLSLSLSPSLPLSLLRRCKGGLRCGGGPVWVVRGGGGAAARRTARPPASPAIVPGAAAPATSPAAPPTARDP